MKTNMTLKINQYILFLLVGLFIFLSSSAVINTTMDLSHLVAFTENLNKKASEFAKNLN